MLKLENDIQILEDHMNTNPSENIQIALNEKKLELENRRNHIIEGLILHHVQIGLRMENTALNIFVNWKKNLSLIKLFLN